MHTQLRELFLQVVVVRNQSFEPAEALHRDDAVLRPEKFQLLEGRVFRVLYPAGDRLKACAMTQVVGQLRQNDRLGVRERWRRDPAGRQAQYDSRRQDKAQH